MDVAIVTTMRDAILRGSTAAPLTWAEVEPAPGARAHEPVSAQDYSAARGVAKVERKPRSPETREQFRHVRECTDPALEESQ